MLQVLAIGTIHKYILHWLDARGIVAVQSVPKNELLSISEATGAKLIYQPNFMDNTGIFHLLYWILLTSLVVDRPWYCTIV